MFDTYYIDNLFFSLTFKQASIKFLASWETPDLNIGGTKTFYFNSA